MITTKCHIDFIIHWPKGINNNGIIIISVTEDTLLYYHTCGVFSFTNGMGTTEEEKAGSAVKSLIPLTAICPVDRKLLKLDHVSSQNSQSQCTSWPVRTEKVLCFLWNITTDFSSYMSRRLQWRTRGDYIRHGDFGWRLSETCNCSTAALAS